MKNNPLSRRTFLTVGAAAAASLSVPGVAQQAVQAVKKPRPPALNADLVKEFVIAAHGNFDKTKELLQNERGLINATWDWGGGDFEMAIGGAGHTGSRDIALYLIGEGGRMDVFVAAMLGEIEMVRTTLATFPHMLHTKGPHGIPLEVHAKMGGEPAAPVLEFLKSLKAG